MEAIAGFLTDFHHRVLSWFKDDVFRRLFLNAGKLLSANAVAAVLGLVATVLTARAYNAFVEHYTWDTRARKVLEGIAV